MLTVLVGKFVLSNIALPQWPELCHHEFPPAHNKFPLLETAPCGKLMMLKPAAK